MKSKSVNVSKKAFKLTYMSTVGTSDIAKEIGLKIYPNPASDFILVSLDRLLDLSEFALLNIYGQKIKSGKLVARRNSISMKGLSPGNYFLVFNINGVKIAQSILKK